MASGEALKCFADWSATGKELSRPRRRNDRRALLQRARRSPIRPRSRIAEERARKVADAKAPVRWAALSADGFMGGLIQEREGRGKGLRVVDRQRIEGVASLPLEIKVLFIFQIWVLLAAVTHVQNMHLRASDLVVENIVVHDKAAKVSDRQESLGAYHRKITQQPCRIPHSERQALCGRVAVPL
jgi:hypothetical protein